MFFRNTKIEIEFHTRPFSTKWQLSGEVVQTEQIKSYGEV